VAFSVFGKDIYWYGIIIAVGFLLASLYCGRYIESFGLNLDLLYDGILAAVPAAIVGARAYYVLFSWSDYQENPIEVFKIWKGGLAIYGGILGALLALAIFCRVRRLSTPAVFDVGCMGIIIGQIFGRWGNFVNGEAHGGATDLPWGMSINGDTPVHPTFLYESLWNLVGFLILNHLRPKKKFQGQLFLTYLAWYGFGRMMIEGLRADSLYLPGTGVRVSQLLSAVLCVAACVLLILCRKKQVQTLSQLWDRAADPRPIRLSYEEEMKQSASGNEEQTGEAPDEEK
jgi:phosphatidylglycerol:prolipoprotein diacylglycerol transferase